jgi:ankyrin repeat protein
MNIKRSIYNRDINSVKKLLENGLNPNVSLKNKYHFTPLHYMLSSRRIYTQDDVDIVKLLIEYNIDVNCDNGKLFELVCYNTDQHQNGYYVMIIELLLNNANVNSKRTLVRYSFRWYKWYIIKLLFNLKNKIDLDDIIKNDDEILSDNISLRVKQMMILHLKVDTLRKKINDVLYIACDTGYYDAVKRILDADSSDINTLKQCESLLDHISHKLEHKYFPRDNYINIAKILVDYGAAVNISTMNNIIVSYALSRNNTIVSILKEFVPKVLVDIIIIFNANFF